MKRTEQVNVRLSAEEREALEAAAARCGLSLAEWLRAVAVAASGNGSLQRALRAAEREQSRRTNA